MTDPARVADRRPPRRLAAFQITKQHRRFVEFADAVRRQGTATSAPATGLPAWARRCPPEPTRPPMTGTVGSFIVTAGTAPSHSRTCRP